MNSVKDKPTPITGKVTIKCLDYNEYIYGDTKIFKIDKKAGRVFSYTPRTLRKEAYWIIEPAKRKNLVRIKNVYFNGYLHCGDLYNTNNINNSFNQRRSLFVCLNDRVPHDESFYFRLQPIQGSVYQIVNHLGETMYAATLWFNLNEERRIVFACKEERLPRPKTTTGYFEIVNC